MMDFLLRRSLLPLRPLWMGLIVNFSVFAFGWYIVLAAPSAARSLIRKRRGLCPRCGYDLGGDPHAGCPECGLGLAAAQQ